MHENERETIMSEKEKCDCGDDLCTRPCIVCKNNVCDDCAVVIEDENLKNKSAIIICHHCFTEYDHE